MKKIALLLVSAVSVFAFAQRSQVDESVRAQLKVEKHADVKNAVAQPVLPAITPEVLSTVRKAGVAAQPKSVAPARAAVKKAAADSVFYAMYERPAGTFFCGIDREGTFAWFNFPSLVGAWKNGLKTWTYMNASEGAESVQWKSRLYNAYPQYFNITADGDFVDSLMQEFPRDGYPELPALIASKSVDGVQVKDSFVLLGYPGESVDTTIANTYVWNGSMNPLSDDGMFPLTNAMVYNKLTGSQLSMLSVWEADSATQTWSYAYGTKPITYEGATGDVTIQPSALMVVYDKPQAPLFINEITVALDAIEFDATKNDFADAAVNFNQLAVLILSIDGDLIASSTCSINDTTNNMYFPGSMAHFSFQEVDEYGMVVSDGISLNEPFIVMLSGLDQANANFGIVSSYNPYFDCNTIVVDTAGTMHAYVNADPYIMLNGIFYTLEDNTETLYGLTNYGDTVNMIVEHDASGVYYLIHADGDLEGYYNVALAATELLYDTTTYQYNYNIIAPDWANNIVMEWVSDGFDLWYYYNTYELFIEGVEEYFEADTELPKVGDEIKLSKYGRELVYKIVEVPADQAVETVDANGVKIRKIVRNGQVLILRGDKRYNLLGAEL